MIETLISIVSGANAAFDLYRNITSLKTSEGSTDRYLDTIASELGRLNLRIERLSERILYLPDLDGIKDLSSKSQPKINDLRRVRESLEPVQKALDQEIISSSVISTPDRLLKAMRKSPWDVLVEIRPAQRVEVPANSALVPVLFQDSEINYIGWTPRGSLPGMFDCEYNELWLPANTKKIVGSISKEDVNFNPGINYTRLQDLLSSSQFELADEETKRIVLDVSNGFSGGWENKIPCKDLATINKLWIKYSNENILKRMRGGFGRYGFGFVCFSDLEKRCKACQITL